MNPRSVTFCGHFLTYYNRDKTVHSEAGFGAEETVEHRAYNTTEHDQNAALRYMKLTLGLV